MKNFTKLLRKSIEDILFYHGEQSIEMITKTVFESILKAERSEFLNLNKNPKNKANGYYPRLCKSINKYFRFNIPRDRLSLFKPAFLEILSDIILLISNSY